MVKSAKPPAPKRRHPAPKISIADGSALTEPKWRMSELRRMVQKVNITHLDRAAADGFDTFKGEDSRYGIAVLFSLGRWLGYLEAEDLRRQVAKLEADLAAAKTNDARDEYYQAAGEFNRARAQTEKRRQEIERGLFVGVEELEIAVGRSFEIFKSQLLKLPRRLLNVAVKSGGKNQIFLARARNEVEVVLKSLADSMAEIGKDDEK